MPKSETRQFLEEQFEKYEKPKEEEKETSAEKKTEELADKYLQAPLGYKEEYREMFKTLPEQMRQYLCEREEELEKEFKILNSQMEIVRFLNDAFTKKGKNHGFKTAQEWIEKLIFAEDLMETSPKETLVYLAKAYGVSPDFENKPEPNEQELKFYLLQSELKELKERFEEREHRLEEISKSAEAARKAKDAGFSPQGKSASLRHMEGLTTRQILEKKFAELED